MDTNNLLTTAQVVALLQSRLGRNCPPAVNLERYVRRYAARDGLGVRIGPAPSRGEADRRDRLFRPVDVDSLTAVIRLRPPPGWPKSDRPKSRQSKRKTRHS